MIAGLTMYAGAVINSLLNLNPSLSDAAKMAHRLFLRNPNEPMDLVKKASHVKRLINLGLKKDIEFCFRKDLYPILAILRSGVMVKASGQKI